MLEIGSMVKRGGKKGKRKLDIGDGELGKLLQGMRDHSVLGC